MSDLSPQPDFSALLSLIHQRRLRVALLVNRELIDLYWEIGKHLDQDGWGKSTVRHLSDYLLMRQPGSRVFSTSNLWRMRQFYQTWRCAAEEIATLLRDLPWSGHVDLLGRCVSDAEREFYLGLFMVSIFLLEMFGDNHAGHDLVQLAAPQVRLFPQFFVIGLSFRGGADQALGRAGEGVESAPSRRRPCLSDHARKSSAPPSMARAVGWAYPAAASDIDPTHPEFRLIDLLALVTMKLTSYRRKDQVHLLDMVEIGHLDASWLPRVPPGLRQRLQDLLDDPDG